MVAVKERRPGPTGLGSKVLTTGQVAKVCRVAPRTVSKWFDSGKLKGYRLAGSQDRRVPREELVRFLRENNMPLGELDDDRPSVAVLSEAADVAAWFGESAAVATDGFALAVEILRLSPLPLVVIDTAIGGDACRRIAARVREAAPDAEVWALGWQDDPESHDWADRTDRRGHMDPEKYVAAAVAAARG